MVGYQGGHEFWPVEALGKVCVGKGGIADWDDVGEDGFVGIAEVEVGGGAGREASSAEYDEGELGEHGENDTAAGDVEVECVHSDIDGIEWVVIEGEAVEEGLDSVEADGRVGDGDVQNVGVRMGGGAEDGAGEVRVKGVLVGEDGTNAGCVRGVGFGFAECEGGDVSSCPPNKHELVVGADEVGQGEDIEVSEGGDRGVRAELVGGCGTRGGE